MTAGDYDLPLRISRFVAELSGGFRLLNLKNDSLRKRFDALKYDVKKIEESFSKDVSSQVGNNFKIIN